MKKITAMLIALAASLAFACGDIERDYAACTEDPSLCEDEASSESSLKSVSVSKVALGQDQCGCNPGYTPDAYCYCNGGSGCSSGTCADDSSCSCSGSADAL
jgi:hypothetical protein